MALQDIANPFVWGAGGARKTPEQIARDREMAAALMGKGVDFSPIASPWQGLARVANAAVGAYGDYRTNQAEAANAETSRDIVARMLSGAGGQQFPAAPNGTNVPLAGDYADARVKTAFGDNAADIKQGLVDRGMSPQVADAFVMNFQDESGLNPGVNEQNPVVAGSRGGFGLAQWTGPRRRALEAYAAQRGAPVSDTGTQLDYLMSELQGPEAKAYQTIAAAPNTGSAAAAIVNQFLRPAEEHRAARERRYLATGGDPVQVASLDANIGVPFTGQPLSAEERAQKQAELQPTLSQIGQPYTPPKLPIDVAAALSGKGDRLTMANATPIAMQPGPLASGPAQSGFIDRMTDPASMTGGSPMPMQGAPASATQTATTAPETVVQALTGQDLSRVPVTAGGNAGVYQPGQSQGFNPAIIEALSSPYADDQTKRIAGMLLGQQMQQQQATAQAQAARNNWVFQQQYQEQANARDPLRQAQIEKARREAQYGQPLINAGGGAIYNPNSDRWLTSPTPAAAAKVGGSSVDLESLPQVGMTGDGVVDKSAQGEFLKQLPPSIASQVQGIADGRIDIRNVTSLRGGERQELAKLVSLYDPSWDMSQVGARAAAQRDYTSGEMAKLAGSTNLAIKHMGGMVAAGERLGNTWFTPWNTIKNIYGSNTDDPDIKSFNTYRLGVADELGKAFHGVGTVPESQVKAWQEAISSSSGPEQLKASVTSALEMLAARTETYNQRYRNVMGKDAPMFLDKTAVKVLQDLKIDPSHVDPRYAGSAPSSGGDGWNDAGNGVKIRVKQ